MTAALALAQLVTDSDLEHGSLYPALPRIREVSAAIAARGKASGFGYAWPPRRNCFRIPVSGSWALMQYTRTDHAQYRAQGLQLMNEDSCAIRRQRVGIRRLSLRTAA